VGSPEMPAFGAMSSPVNTRCSQCEPTMVHWLVGWFSSSAPFKVGQSKKSRASANTVGVSIFTMQLGSLNPDAETRQVASMELWPIGHPQLEKPRSSNLSRMDGDRST